jgi:hypothetical protein
LKTPAPQLGLTFVGDPRHDFEALRAAFGDFRRFQGSVRPRLLELDARRATWGVNQPRHLPHSHIGVDRKSLFEAAAVFARSNPRPVPGLSRTTQAMAGVDGSSRHRDAQIAMPTHQEFEFQYLAELQSFLTPALDAARQFRTSQP